MEDIFLFRQISYNNLPLTSLSEILHKTKPTNIFIQAILLSDLKGKPMADKQLYIPNVNTQIPLL